MLLWHGVKALIASRDEAGMSLMRDLLFVGFGSIPFRDVFEADSGAGESGSGCTG